jgi:D-glycero-D-manno-heptose 1,7-bisphosphate phosphatase
MNKCVFLDRDGVLNEERNDYTYRVQDFKVIDGVIEAIEQLYKIGYKLIVVTNQAGISKGLYTVKQMQACHEVLLSKTDKIDHIYYCPYHPSITQSLLRKPDTLMFEKAIARYHIDVSQSWMVGDAERDIQAGKAMGVKTIKVGNRWLEETVADHRAENLWAATQKIILTQ